MRNSEEKLNVILVSDQTSRIASLKRDLTAAGINAALVLQKPGPQTAQKLRRIDPATASPHLVLIDFTSDDKPGRRFLKSIAFGDRRTRAVIAILTSRETEELLQTGQIDGGDATMFSPITQATLLAKLSGARAPAVLRSMSVLNQYGPVLIAADVEAGDEDAARESA